MKIGYGILVHSRGWMSRVIRRFTKSYWNHVAISLGGYDIVEAGWRGVRLHNLRRYDKRGVELKVFKVKNVPDKKRYKAALFAATKCNLKYDYLQLLLIGVLLKLNRPNWAKRLAKALNKATKSYICSEVYYEAWLMVGEVLCPGKDISEITPADLNPDRNKNLEGVFRYKNT
jgi:uncharacterized protein YycO